MFYDSKDTIKKVKGGPARVVHTYNLKLLGRKRI
jgi:hypothetical protein